MNIGAKGRSKKANRISNFTLIILAFATCFFSRNIVALGFPSVINFLHFFTVPVACGIILVTTRVKNQSQIVKVKLLILNLFILLGVMIASSLLNEAGAINLLLNFMMLAEPFILLAAIISLPMTIGKLEKFQVWLTRFCLFHLILAISQYFLLQAGLMKFDDMTLGDNVQGVFYFSNGGHVVGASVSTTFSLYYFLTRKNVFIWLRILILLASQYHLLLADAKQVMLVMFLSWFLLIIINLKDIRKTLLSIIAAFIVVNLFIWCMENVEHFRHFNTWIRPGIYGPNGEATLLKTSSIRIIISYFQSPLNWLFGLGPGHTVDRLGGWMLGYKFGRYWDLLQPFGATRLAVSADVWDIYKDHWLDSSMFSPLFSWVGIWGNFGFLGLGAYLLLWAIVWHQICSSDFSRYMILNVLIHGFIFTQLEEPGYMLLIAFFIGVRWHELSLSKKKVLN